MNVRSMNPGIYTALWLLPVLALLQATLVNHLQVRGTLAQIVLIAVVDWGILRGLDEGVIWAFWGGLCIDALSGWPIGTATVSLVVVASLVSLGQGTFMRTHVLIPPVTVFGATLVYYIVAFFILESTLHSVSWVETLRIEVLPMALFNALLNIPAFALFRRLESRIYPQPRANW